MLDIHTNTNIHIYTIYTGDYRPEGNIWLYRGVCIHHRGSIAGKADDLLILVMVLDLEGA